MGRHVKSKVNGCVMPWTVSLGKNRDVFECDEKGNPIGDDSVAETPVVVPAEPPMAAGAPETAIDVPPVNPAAAFSGGDDDGGN